MKKKIIFAFSTSIILLMLSTLIIAQDDKRTIKSAASSLYVISAKAGGVNYIEGSVAVQRKTSGAGYLVKGDQIEVGDKVSTDRNSKAEILLNPGSFARLGSNTEFEFITTSLDDLKLQISRGTAIFEVYASNDFVVTVKAPNARFYLVKSGVYRVDVLENGSSRLQVWKGRAQVGDINANKVKKSRAVVLNGSNVSIQKFDRDEKDPFDAWSKSRAKQLAKANARLRRKTLKNSLVSGFRSNRWNSFNTFGLWTFDASFGGYCFLPFSYGWRSPYGYGFRRNFFSSRPSSSFYYAVQRSTYRIIRNQSNNRGSSNRGNRGRVNRGSGNDSGRVRRGNSGRARPRGVSPGRSRVGPRSRPINRPRSRPMNRPRSMPRRPSSTMRNTRRIKDSRSIN